MRRLKSTVVWNDNSFFNFYFLNVGFSLIFLMLIFMLFVKWETSLYKINNSAAMQNNTTLDPPLLQLLLPNCSGTRHRPEGT
jgi:hypothetical protein